MNYSSQRDDTPYVDPKKRVKDDRFHYTPRTVVLSLFGILFGVFLCFGGTLVVIDNVCAQNAAEYLLYYPNAEVASEDYTFVRAWGMGETTVVLETDDSTIRVLDWYRDNRPTIQPVNLLATMDQTVRRDDATGGTRIVLTSECAWE